MGNNIFTNRNTDTAAINEYTKFNGFYTNLYRDPFTNGYAFIFVTKPLLFINPRKPVSTNSVEGQKNMSAYINMTRDPTFASFLTSETMNKLDKKIAESLSFIIDYSDSAYLPIFTNTFKNFDPNDIVMDTSEAFVTKQGFREQIPTFKTTSEGANTLSISVTEDSNLTFTKMMTLWVNYISHITDGTFDANPDMINAGSLDYMSSIYYFVLEPDGRTLKYWSKYAGCWPTTIPYSKLAYSKGTQDVVDIEIPFIYTVKEDMNPKILEEFNMLSLKLLNTDINQVITDDLYVSNKTNVLLNKTELDKLVPLKNRSRDPIILFKQGTTKTVNSDATEDHYELLFDNDGYKSQFIDSILENENYYFNDTATNNYVEDGKEPDWKDSDFWKEQ